MFTNSNKMEKKLHYITVLLTSGSSDLCSPIKSKFLQVPVFIRFVFRRIKWLCCNNVLRETVP